MCLLNIFSDDDFIILLLYVDDMLIVGHDTSMTDQMRCYISAVNGSSQTAHIYGFVNAMPASDSRFLRATYQALMPNFDLRQHFVCDTCGYEQDMEVPFTADFFWPKQ